MRKSTQAHTLDVRSLREVHVVDSVDEVLCGDALAAEEATIQSLDGVLSTLDAVEFDVDLSIGRTGRNTNVHYLAVAVSALFFDVFFEFLVPTGGFSATSLVSISPTQVLLYKDNLLFLSVQVLEQDTSTWCSLIGRCFLLLSLGCILRLRFFGSGKLAHERIA